MEVRNLPYPFLRGQPLKFWIPRGGFRIPGIVFYLCQRDLALDFNL